ncbi:hypothetical protein [Tunturiibacter lichenicola]|uniref:GAP1-N1 domain-containing protein n=1 Tax=Tunturiibacter lichenicola TaxID=2051959 RepID=UPI003D9AFA3B
MTSAHAHQLLHGYRSGHGQIAASIKLPGRDSELITRLSDLSGSLSSGLQIEPYLTVYPLPSRHFFALARTWPDVEAPRAGCVLTHTLLIPTEVWATLHDVRSLNRLFRNPHISPEYSFTDSVDLRARSGDASPSDLRLDLPRARSFVSRYFGQGLRPIVWFNASDPEEYLWRLLEHLWPKLRSSFSSCTFSLQQRVLHDRPFDLLFAPSIVYARFTKLPPDQLIEPTAERKGGDVEPWSEYWAKAFFSADPGLPTNESELPIWSELSEDPTAVRKLSLVQELRLRAMQSPTAGVGAMDVVESLAHDSAAAVPLKQLIVRDAIDATIAATSAEDALTSLKLIEDRLHRESFRNIAANFYQPLSHAASKVTLRDPETAMKLSASWLVDRHIETRSAFADGILEGLINAANSFPSRLEGLRFHPDIAVELLRLHPDFASKYLEIGGETAPRVLASWLSTNIDLATLKQVRRSLIPSLKTYDPELFPALLRDVSDVEAIATLDALSKSSLGFADQNMRRVVADRISLIHPQLVRTWGSKTRLWSPSTAFIVASAYGHSKQGFEELLQGHEFTGDRQAEVLAAMLCSQDFGDPYWLRELMSHDARILTTLLLNKGKSSDDIECALSKVLSEVSDLFLASSDELLSSIWDFEGRPVFRQLADAAARSAVASYIAEGRDTTVVREVLANPISTRWLESISASQLGALLVRSCNGGTAFVERALKWISEAPNALYARRPSVLPELCDVLLSRVRQFGPPDAQYPLIQIVRRAAVLPGFELKQVLAAKMLRFCLDNVHLSLSALVAETFPNVYMEAIKENDRRPSFFASLFAAYDWDKGKDLRITLIDSFLRSEWAPGDLAIAASRAGILRKIFKRLSRKQGGDNYIRATHADLAQRKSSDIITVRNDFELLMKDPDFYEEWD